jgi:hypothetical protein
MKIRRYRLYVDGFGNITNKSIAYAKGTHTHFYDVMAKSIKHAYWLVGNDVWMNEDTEVGIFYDYDKE